MFPTGLRLFIRVSSSNVVVVVLLPDYLLSTLTSCESKSVLTRLAQHTARWAERGSVTEGGGGGGREGGGGELGFQLPAFTPSLTLKIAPITGAFWGDWSLDRVGQCRVMLSLRLIQ